MLAALGVVEALEELSRSQERGIRLSVRIGIHTGPVVTGGVGTGTTRERLAMGQTPNVAARFQGLAEPGWVVVGAETRDLVASFFTFEALGPRAVKRLPTRSRPIGSSARAAPRAASTPPSREGSCRSSGAGASSSCSRTRIRAPPRTAEAAR